MCCHVADTEVGGINLYFLLHIKEWATGGTKPVTPEKLLTVSTWVAFFDEDSIKD